MAFSLEVVPSGKRCSKCKRTLPPEAFARSRARRGGLAAYCRECTSVYMASGVKRKSRLKTTYGITPEQYDEMLRAQRGVCGACGNPPSKADKWRLAIDHNHHSGRLRGLLCARCNTALGLLRDDRDVITRLWKYLDRWTDAHGGEGGDDIVRR